jgi:hypothetical protein
MELCGGCGVIALGGQTRCEVCEHEHTAPRPAVPRLFENRYYWVAVRVRFRCHGCRHKSPLNHLDMDGSAACVACGTEQELKARGWTRPIKHAHGVGDLSGPNGEGRFPDPALCIAAHNELADVGVSRVWAFSGQQGRTVGGGAHESIEIEAAPGHPLCTACRAPLHIAARSSESITLRCVACSAPPTSYPTPPQAKGTVAGAVSVEQSSARLDLDVLMGAGEAVAVRCPSCSAPLDLSGGTSVIPCRFCGVTARLSNAVLVRLGFKNVKPIVWWLLFEGPSSRRVEPTQLAVRARKKQR